MIAHHLTFFDFLENIKSYFPLRETGFYSLIIAFLPTIIAISYPIIIQTITKLNEIYSSTQIINSFKKEAFHVYFKTCLIISLILSGLTFLNYDFINVLAFIFVLSLIIIFIKYIELILIYNDPNELFNHILKKSNIKEIDKEENNIIRLQKTYDNIIINYHEIVCDLYCYSIRLEDFTLSTNIRDKYFYLISSIGIQIKENEGDYITFETTLYNNNFKIIEEYIKNSSKETRYKPIEFFSTEFYLPYSLRKDAPTPFDNQTFVAIWKNIILITKVANYPKLKRHWEVFENYYNLYLRRSYLEYDENSKVTKESFQNNQRINQFRLRFIEFNISFLALIYYKQQYTLVEELIFHTQSIPPRTFISRFSPQSILAHYFDFQKDIFEKKWEMYYYFDDLEFDSIGFQKDSKYYISEFCLLLFLYTWINEYGTNLKKDVATYIIPSDLPSCKLISSKIPYIIETLNKLLNNEALINVTSLSLISRRKCLLGDIKYPIDYLISIKEQCERKTEERLSYGDLDPQKIQALKDNTVESIKSVFEDISRIKGPDVSKENRDNISDFMETIRGTRIPLNREAFLSDPTIHYIDSEEILGRLIKDQYYAHLIDKLELLNSQNYTVEFKELFLAIDQLKLKDHIIISTNLNLDYLNKFLNIGLVKSDVEGEDYSYNGIPIYSFKGGRNHKGKLYILRKVDKPMIKHKNWPEIKNATSEFNSRWGKMELINKELFIYFEKIELSNTPELLNMYRENSNYKDDELSKMIQFDVDFLGYCWFPKSVKIVSISQGNTFQQGGNLDKLETVKPF